jgi:hypothetical protein
VAKSHQLLLSLFDLLNKSRHFVNSADWFEHSKHSLCFCFLFFVFGEKLRMNLVCRKEQCSWVMNDTPHWLLHEEVHTKQLQIQPLQCKGRCWQKWCGAWQTCCSSTRGLRAIWTEHPTHGPVLDEDGTPCPKT